MAPIFWNLFIVLQNFQESGFFAPAGAEGL
jgi:hypothetical protein